MVDFLIPVFQVRELGPQNGEVAVLDSHSQYQRAASRNGRTLPILLSLSENRAFYRACPPLYQPCGLTPPGERGQQASPSCFFTNRTSYSSCPLPACQLCPSSVGNEDLTCLEIYLPFSLCVFLLCVVGQYDFEIFNIPFRWFISPQMPSIGEVLTVNIIDMWSWKDLSVLSSLLFYR